MLRRWLLTRHCNGYRSTHWSGNKVVTVCKCIFSNEYLCVLIEISVYSSGFNRQWVGIDSENVRNDARMRYEAKHVYFFVQCGTHKQSVMLSAYWTITYRRVSARKRNSSALAMELCLSCTKPSILYQTFIIVAVILETDYSLIVNRV